MLTVASSGSSEDQDSGIETSRIRCCPPCFFLRSIAVGDPFHAGFPIGSRRIGTRKRDADAVIRKIHDLSVLITKTKHQLAVWKRNGCRDDIRLKTQTRFCLRIITDDQIVTRLDHHAGSEGMHDGFLAIGGNRRQRPERYIRRAVESKEFDPFIGGSKVGPRPMHFIDEDARRRTRREEPETEESDANHHAVIKP